MDEQHCPYAEESQAILVTVYVSSKHFLVENYSTRFFLSEIGETFPGHGNILIFVHIILCPLSSVQLSFSSLHQCGDLALSFALSLVSET